MSNRFYYINCGNIMRLVVLFLAMSCSNSSSESEKNGDGNGADSSGIIVPAIQSNKDSNLSGRYGEMSVAIDSNNNLTGTYEYYDGWDESYKEYMRICRFYFSGKLKGNDSIFEINAYWPGTDQKLYGEVRMMSVNDSIKIGMVLNDIPYGYAAVDFTRENEYFRKLDKRKDWIQIKLIKSAKSNLYNFADSSKIRKGYLIKNDIVKVLKRQDKWYYIEYNPPNDNNRSIFAWVREGDIF